MAATPAHPFSDHPFFADDGPLPLAHAGGGLEEVENSTAAFANAVRLGYRHLDIDLQATSDGVLVAHHDDSLQRLTGVDAVMSELTWQRVSELRLANGEPLARFDDLVETHSEALWNIELKDDASIGPAIDLIRSRDLHRRVCLNTFNDLRMRRIRKAAAELEPAYSTPIASTLWLKAASWVPFLPYRTSADCTQAPVEDRGIKVLDERFVDRAHRAGLGVIVWTINEAEEMRRLLDIGVDGILTDAPTVLKTVLDGR